MTKNEHPGPSWKQYLQGLFLGSEAPISSLVRRNFAAASPPSGVPAATTTPLPQTASVARAAALMALEGVDRWPILGPRGHVVGVITARDVMQWLAQRSGFLSPPGMRTRRDAHESFARHERGLRAIGAAIDREISSLGAAPGEDDSIDGASGPSAPDPGGTGTGDR